MKGTKLRRVHRHSQDDALMAIFMRCTVFRDETKQMKRGRTLRNQPSTYRSRGRKMYSQERTGNLEKTAVPSSTLNQGEGKEGEGR